MNLLEALEGFKKYFGWNKPEIDNLATTISGTPTFDIFAFEDFLTSKFGDFSEEGFSTKEFIERKFGQEAVDFCMKAFGIN